MAGRSRRGLKRKRAASSSDEENSSTSDDNNNELHTQTIDQETFMKKTHQYTKKNRKIIRAKRNQRSTQWLKNLNANERRDLRMAFRSLENNIHDNIDELRNPLTHKLMEYTLASNELSTMVNHPLEAAQEISIQRELTQVAYDQAKLLANEQMSISTSEFITALKQNYTTDDSLDLFKLSDDICDVIPFLPSISFLSGIIDNDLLNTSISDNDENKKKKRKPLRRRKNNEKILTQQIKPSQITKENEQLKNETTKRVRYVRDEIKELVNYHIDQPQISINLIETMHNSKSFSKTIENWFDLSHIVREGDVNTIIDPNTKQPMLNYVPSAVKQRQKEIATQNNEQLGSQSIVKFDMTTWMNITKAYKLDNKQPKIDSQLNKKKRKRGR